MYSKILIFLILTAKVIFGQEDDPPETQPDFGNSSIVFSLPDLLQIPEDTVQTVTWNTTLEGVVSFVLTSDDTLVGKIVDGASIEVYTDEGNLTAGGEFNVSTHRVGYNTITLVLMGQDSEELGFESLDMSVVVGYQAVNDFFSTSTSVLLAISYVNMGATIDLQLVKQIVKKPIGPILGIVCQYIGMPLLALGLGYLAFPDDALMRLGMFMAGCVPGGGPSNMWTHLLGGSLDLSVMMTFTSTVAAFGFLPAWVLGIGPVIIGDDQTFELPFVNIAIIIILLIIPCSIGLLIQRYLPRLQKVLTYTLTPFSLFYIIYIFTFGIYANRFIFDFFTPKVVFSSIALPWMGYFLGLSLAYVCKQSVKDRIAISIETGIQNVALAIVMMNLTLEQPAGVLTIVIPCITVLATPIPLLLIYTFKVIYTKYFKKQSDQEEQNEKPEGSMIAEGKLTANSMSKASIAKISVIEMPEEEDSNKEPLPGGIDNPAAELSDKP